MAGFRHFLERFRPVGLPGPAAAAGVPADRSAELAAELQLPLTLLDAAENEARAVRESAAREAERRRQAAERDAADIVARARAGAREVRERSAARIRHRTEAEAAAATAAADRGIAALRERVERRLPELVDRTVAAAVGEADRPDDEPPGGGTPRWAPGG
jgi:hypothetical protein